MEITVRTVKLTKSKILQMNYVFYWKCTGARILGWVRVNDKKYTLIKFADQYFRTDFITDISSTVARRQFSDGNGGCVFPYVTVIKVKVWNQSNIVTHFVQDEDKNLKDLEFFRNFKKETESSGQIYY